MFGMRTSLRATPFNFNGSSASGRYETAFQMLHKLRAAMARPNQDGIGGEWPVELDETWVGGHAR